MSTHVASHPINAHHTVPHLHRGYAFDAPLGYDFFESAHVDDHTKTVNWKDERPNNSVEVGEVLAGYEIKGLLAEGGQGSVYAVVHRMLGRPAAMKVLHHFLLSSRDMTERFIREAQIVNQLRHPGIVDIYDLGMLSDGRPYMVMELLYGRTLSEILFEGRLEAEKALEYLKAIGAGLSAAHALGVVHRDVKGGNVFVTHEKSPVKVKLLDFGIAKFVAPEEGMAALTKLGDRLGSAGSMAPEQYLGTSVDARTDVYGLAVTAYRMVTGRYPFVSADAGELERMHLEVTPKRPSEWAPIPVAIDRVLLKALEKKKELRHQSVQVFLDDFEAALRSPVAVVASPVADDETARVGLVVDIELSDEEQNDDDVLVGLAELLDTGERFLRENGFAIEQQGDRQICGMREALDVGPRQGLDGSNRLVEIGHELLGVLSAQAPEFHITIRARIGSTDVTKIQSAASVEASSPA